MRVVVIGPWRLELCADADRWQGVDAPTDAVRLRGCGSAPGWLHLSMRIETVAVMIHAMGGASERPMPAVPRLMPGLRANFADLFGGVRTPSFVASAPSERFMTSAAVRAASDQLRAL